MATELEMHDQIAKWEINPSRLVCWGAVALLHGVLWWTLSHGMQIYRHKVELEAIQVSMVPPEPPPPVTPPQANLVVTKLTPVWVPEPEVQVTHEPSSDQVITSTVASAISIVSAVTQSPPASNAVTLVQESEVDYLRKPQIRFPTAAQRAREHGVVLLSIVIDERGEAMAIRVFKSSGFQRLDDAAVRALHSARFKPYLKNGIAVPIEIRVPVEFPQSA